MSAAPGRPKQANAPVGGGEVHEVTSVGALCSELERAREEIRRLQLQLAQAAQAMEDYTYSVSHDLRASLRHVSSYLRIVREDLGEALDPAIAAHLDTAGEAAAQMGRLMDGLLELSRVGRAELQLSAVDLGRLIAELRRQMEVDGSPRRIEWAVAPDIPVVQGDVALLGQMLARLLDNAVKFTRECPVARIDIGWGRRDDGALELRIRDNGVGFDPRFQDRLFRVFQRLHSARQFEGMGIGLALARRVVERHGGTIRADGDMRPGCQVSLTLPIAAGG